MVRDSLNVEISENLSENVEKKITKQSVLRYAKFFLIPGWRDPDFNSREYEIGRFKSKRRVFRRLLTPLTITGLGFIFFITFLAVYAPWLTPFTIRRVTDSAYAGATPFLPPNAEHILGTTEYGFDLLGRIIWGARTAIIFGFITIIIASVGGVVVGTAAGYYGGRVETILMRIVDFVIIFPGTVLIILLVELSGNPGLLNMLIIFGLFAITGYSRLMRASVLQVKQELYIEAAKTGGANDFKVMFKHVFSNAISPIIISFFGGVGGAILGFSGIAFLGFGDESLPDWGTDISYASSRLSSIHATLWPGLFILIAVLGFMLLGDGLRDALDPRLQQTKG
ncbi:MAG: ABC transporter permease [Promethearchaeota archaeon]|jgi:ABC-type dipeptide/oligopeptide/nickel transport system permease subunit